MESEIKIETTISETHYASYLPEHDIYYSTPISKGMEEVNKRAKILVECKKDFEMKYGWMFDRN